MRSAHTFDVRKSGRLRLFHKPCGHLMGGAAGFYSCQATRTCRVGWYASDIYAMSASELAKHFEVDTCYVCASGSTHSEYNPCPNAPPPAPREVLTWVFLGKAAFSAYRPAGDVARGRNDALGEVYSPMVELKR